VEGHVTLAVFKELWWKEPSQIPYGINVDLTEKEGRTLKAVLPECCKKKKVKTEAKMFVKPGCPWRVMIGQIWVLQGCLPSCETLPCALLDEIYNYLLGI
jgi:hypothetical protein